MHRPRQLKADLPLDGDAPRRCAQLDDQFLSPDWDEDDETAFITGVAGYSLFSNLCKMNFSRRVAPGACGVRLTSRSPSVRLIRPADAFRGALCQSSSPCSTLHQT